jgi:hypothetical protein
MDLTSTAASSNNILDTLAAQARFRVADVPVKEDAVSVMVITLPATTKAVYWRYKRASQARLLGLQTRTLMLLVKVQPGDVETLAPLVVQKLVRTDCRKKALWVIMKWAEETFANSEVVLAHLVLVAFVGTAFLKFWAAISFTCTSRGCRHR